MVPEKHISKSEFEDSYDTFRLKVEGENINSQTLLATDYLNHFNEVHMLLDMLPSMPDCIEDISIWKTKSYKDHFRDSVFQAKDLAIAAYDYSPTEYKTAFEDIVCQMDELVLGTITDAKAAIESDNQDELVKIIATYVPQMGDFIEQCSSIIHGSRKTADQNDIDNMFDQGTIDQNAIDELF